MPDQRDKLVHDEQTLGKLLEAAFVLQEHARELQYSGEPNPQRYGEHLGQPADSIFVKQPSQLAVKEESAAPDDYTLILARVVEVQQDIHFRRLELEEAMALVAERVALISKAQGAAIGIIDGKNVCYRAGIGTPALPVGSKVVMEKALCFACVRTGQLIRCTDVNPEFLFDPEQCLRRGIQSLIVVPVYQDPGIAGALELYFSRAHAFTEQDVHTCQLMAGLVTEALARDSQLALKSVLTERDAMPERVKPNPISRADVPATFSCLKCGHQLVGDEQFCGRCGSARPGDDRQERRQSNTAPQWQTKAPSPPQAQAVPNAAVAHVESDDSFGSVGQGIRESQDHGKTEDDLLEPFVVPEFRTDQESGRRAIVSAEDTKGSEESEKEKVEVEAPETALVKTGDVTWSSAATARNFLEQLTASRNQGALERFWSYHRGTVYLAIAVILVMGVIRWELWSDHSVSAGRSAPVSAHRKQVPDADLSLFDKMLIGLGLAEPPEAPEYKGNPGTEVWVDLHTALYYCPGTDLYGKTPRGKYTTQRDAQLDQFEPAYRKACD